MGSVPASRLGVPHRLSASSSGSLSLPTRGLATVVLGPDCPSDHSPDHSLDHSSDWSVAHSSDWSLDQSDNSSDETPLD